MTTTPKRPALLCILDGWGERTDSTDNAISLAPTPVWDRLVASCPHGTLDASEGEVGLPDGQMGNSEVGHMNLGAGRIVLQDLPRIDKSIQDGSFKETEGLKTFIRGLKASGGAAHLMGLLSPGGVHSHQDHLAALAGAFSEAGIPVHIHAFLDGRDTPPKSAAEFMRRFLKQITGLPNVRIATIGGRFYGMDRDKRWERVQQAYVCIMDADGLRAPDPISAIETAYARGETDEFVQPTVIGEYSGITGGDGLLMGNFRADRAREILTAMLYPNFHGFDRSRRPQFAATAGLVEYSSTLAPYMATLFPPQRLEKVLGQVIAEAGRTQLRIAETEKYAHVTFFFNGGEEQQFEGEDRILIPSPKVKTYDLQPQMAAPEVTEKLTAAIRSGKYDLIICNYANGDMVGHTGILGAAQQAAETIDAALKALEEAIKEVDGVMLVTADHGNCEQMTDPETGEPHTAHTLNPVPTVLVNAPAGVTGLRHGRLADVAPTLLDLMGLPQPREMTGASLLVR